MVVKKSFVNWPALALTCIIRLLFWPTTIWISVIAIQRGYSLIMMHVVFSTIGCGFLLVEATLAVSGDALLVAKVSKSGRVTIHWILHFLGLVTLAIGFGMIEVHKIRNNSNQFVSDHAILGLTAYLLAFVVGIFAIPTVWTKLLPSKISLAKFKYIHIFFGIISLVLLWAGQISGLYTFWWRGSNTGTILSQVGYVVGGFLLLIKPCYTTLSRIF